MDTLDDRKYDRQMCDANSSFYEGELEGATGIFEALEKLQRLCHLCGRDFDEELEHIKDMLPPPPWQKGRT